MTSGSALRRAADDLRRLIRAMAAALFVFGAAGCSSLPFIGEKADAEAASPASPAASAPSAAASAAIARADYRLEVRAPGPLAQLLNQYLDLARFQTASDADAIDAAELERLRRGAPAQARGLLETQGYFNAVVTADRIDEPGAAKPLIRVVVEPGALTRVAAIDIAATGPLKKAADTGDKAARTELDRLRGEWRLKPGDAFQQAAWTSAKSAAIAGVRANGYVAADYAHSAATVDAPTNSARLAIEVASGPLYRLGPLHITGLEHFPPDPVLNLTQFDIGTPYSDKTLLDYQERLQKLGLFEGASVTLDPSPATAEAAPVEVRLREAPIQQATFGVGYSTNTGPRATLDYSNRRPFGIDWIGTSKVALGPTNQQIDADLTSYPHSNLWRNFVSGTLQRLTTDDQTLDGYTARVGRSKEDARIDRRYYLEVTHANLIDDPLTSSGDAVTANYNWAYRALDNELLPTTGYALTTQSAIGYSRGTRQFNGGSDDSAKGPLARLYLRLTAYHPLGSWFGSGRLEAGQIISGSPVGIPDTLLFRAGGTDSVRGYGYRELGPTIQGVTLGGRTLFTASLEAAHPIVARHPEFLYALFIDAGDAADSWRGLSPKVGYGAGLRWRSPVGPLSLDLAYGQSVQRFRFHLSVGSEVLMDASSIDSGPVAPPPPPPRARRPLGLKILAAVIGLLVVAVILTGLAAWWLLGTAGGSAWLLSALPGVQAEGLSGALAGDFRARRIVVDLNSGGDRLTLSDVGWRGLSLHRGDGPAWVRLTVDAVDAAAVDLALVSKPKNDKSPPARAPTSLQLPVELELKSLKVAEIRATPLGTAAITGLDAALHLGADAGTAHRLDRLALHYQQIDVGARGRIASTGPMALQANLEASQPAIGSLPAWNAKLQLAGPLAEPVLEATLRAAPTALARAAAPAASASAAAAAGRSPASAGAGAPPAPATASSASGPARPATAGAPSAVAGPTAPGAGAGPTPAGGGAAPAQTLDLHASLRPFAAWPLGELTANARSLDLAAFLATAPTTALDLDAKATSSAADRPAVVTLDLRNTAAGRYDAGRLPVQSIKAEIAARPDRATDIELRSLAAAVGPAGESEGRLTARGRWSPTGWQLDAALEAIRPQRLDGRAPALTLTGPIKLAGGATAAAGKGIDLKADLSGELADAGVRRPVSVRLDTSFDLEAPDKRLHMATLLASAGPSSLKATGSATQAGPSAPWVLKADATLAEFDPGAWLPVDAGSPWKGSRNRIDARLVVDGSARLPAPDESALDALAQARGRTTLALGNGSLLAGVAIGGTAAAESDGAGTARISADLDAGGNSLKVDGRIATRGKTPADSIDLALDARALATLAPVFKLFQPAGADAGLGGRLTAHAHLDGRWPKLTTRGDLDAEGLRAGPLRLQSAVAQWVAGSEPTDRVSLNATVNELRLQPQGGAPGPSLEAASVQLGGTARAHTLDVRLTSRARPPAWAEAATETAASAATPPAGSGNGGNNAGARSSSATTTSSSVAPPTRLTVATLTARGGLVDQKGAPLSGWRGSLQSIDLGSTASRAAPLMRGRDLALEVFWAGGPFRASVAPGRLELLGGAIRWNQLRYAAAPATATPTGRAHPSPGTASGTAALPRIDVDATVEPLRIAPLLAQAQPSFGWGGDLSVGGHVRIETGGSMQADVVVERNSGDLTISDELATRPLGLAEMRLAAKADQGLWNVSARLSGRSLGTAAADATVRTSREALTPPADAPLTGRVKLDIADLGALGNWVPAGWRVGGALRADATLAGQVGKPVYDGQLVGSGITARNFLEGVNATDGDLLVRLAGTTATIDHFTAKAGDGSLRMTGEARFEDAPVVTLELSANRFQVLGRIDRKIVASGKATVRIDPRTMAVAGQFTVDQGLIDITRSDAPKLDEDVTVVRAAGALSPEAAASAAASPSNNAPVPVGVAVVGPPAPSDAPAASRDLALNLQLDLGQQLAIRGHGLAARLAGVLKVSSPQSKLAVNGTVSVVDGTYKAYGQDLVIDRGLVVFSGPVDRPRLDIEATRPKLENIRVGVTITGNVANPRIRLFSEPELSDVDKLSWLVVGRGSDDLGRNESALLQSAAMALVSGEGNGEPGITDRVTKALGLDELSLGQSDGTVKQTVVNVGKKLSDRWTIAYQGGLNAAAGSVQLIYKIAKRLTVRAQAGTESSLDLIWTWRWQ